MGAAVESPHTNKVGRRSVAEGDESAAMSGAINEIASKTKATGAQERDANFPRQNDGVIMGSSEANPEGETTKEKLR